MLSIILSLVFRKALYFHISVGVHAKNRQNDRYENALFIYAIYVNNAEINTCASETRTYFERGNILF